MLCTCESIVSICVCAKTFVCIDLFEGVGERLYSCPWLPYTSRGESKESSPASNHYKSHCSQSLLKLNAVEICSKACDPDSLNSATESKPRTFSAIGEGQSRGWELTAVSQYVNTLPVCCSSRTEVSILGPQKSARKHGEKPQENKTRTRDCATARERSRYYCAEESSMWRCESGWVPFYICLHFGKWSLLINYIPLLFLLSGNGCTDYHLTCWLNWKSSFIFRNILM